MAKRGRRKPGRRGLWNKRLTPDEQTVQREAAFVAIRRLYCESLPLWRVCPQGRCRRHQICSGEMQACIKRGWPLMAREIQEQAYVDVQTGGPHRRRPATSTEHDLRHYPPTNFNH